MENPKHLTNFALLLLGLVACVLGCGGPRPESSGDRQQPRQGGPTAQGSAEPARPSNWRYTDEPDKMGRGAVKTAATTSVNTISLDFPYQGAQHGTLMLRTHPEHGKDVMLLVERGQFLTGVYGCEVLVRFDESRPVRFRATGPADHSTTTLFIQGYPKFVAGLRGAQKVMIEAPFYQAGDQIFEFDVGGLEWEAPAPKKTRN